MKKILLSLLSIGAVAVIAVAATGAFFSDTEVSTNNTFTAGQLDLQIDSECRYYQNDEQVDCLGPETPTPTPFGTWGLDNLTTEKFFNFGDVKPGDYGENTISLHVFDNDAWACMNVSELSNEENGLTEPEQESGDNTGGPGDGELAQNMEFFAWLDVGSQGGWQGGGDGEEGDNEWLGPDSDEISLFTNIIGPASDVLNGRTYTLADSNTSILGDTNPFEASTTYYIGIAWCAGDLEVDSGGHGNMTDNPFLNCDGQAMGNITQTDSMTADLSFYAEQWRNNENFECSDSLFENN